VNRTDPTGHISWLSFVGIIAGFIGVGLCNDGGSPNCGSVRNRGCRGVDLEDRTLHWRTGFLSDVTGIASGILEMSNPEAAASLGWISLVTGTVGLTGYVTAKAVATTFRMTAFARHEENIFAGLNAHERRYYNQYRGMNLGPEVSANAARRRYASFQRRERAPFPFPFGEIYRKP
jgi:hypothetical protein